MSAGRKTRELIRREAGRRRKLLAEEAGRLAADEERLAREVAAAGAEVFDEASRDKQLFLMLRDRYAEPAIGDESLILYLRRYLPEMDVPTRQMVVERLMVLWRAALEEPEP